MLLENIAIPRKTMTLFFVADTSGSMTGSKIGQLNSAIENVLPEIKDISETNADAEIKIAVLEFNTAANWITPNGPIESENFVWNDLYPMGVTALGDACKKLNEKLSVKGDGFMKEATGSFAPVILLLSDGGPTDNYREGLAQLQENNWFKQAIKVAIAIGNDADKDVLAEFVGNREAVVEVHNPEMLRKMIQFVSVRASQVGSQNASSSEQSKQDAFTEELVSYVADVQDDDDDDIW